MHSLKDVYVADLAMPNVACFARNSKECIGANPAFAISQSIARRPLSSVPKPVPKLALSDRRHGAADLSDGINLALFDPKLARRGTVTGNNLIDSDTTTHTCDASNKGSTVTCPTGGWSTFTRDTLNRISGLSSQPAGYACQSGPTGNQASETESSGRRRAHFYCPQIRRAVSQAVGAISAGSRFPLSLLESIPGWFDIHRSIHCRATVGRRCA